MYIFLIEELSFKDVYDISDHIDSGLLKIGFKKILIIIRKSQLFSWKSDWVFKGTGNWPLFVE